MISALSNRKYILLGILLPVAFCFSLLFGGRTLEDAHITFRYVRNFAEGAGFGVWNVGQAPVEGATSFLWMLILGVGMKMNISPFLLSKLIGSAAYLGTVALFAWASTTNTAENKPVKFKTHYLIAAILLTLYAPLAWYSVSGMETTFFSFLVAATVISITLEPGKVAMTLCDAIILLLLVLARPEGMLFGFVLAMYRLFDRRLPTIARVVPLVIFVLTVAGLVGFRIIHFGDPLPNTYYAKASGEWTRFLLFGLKYILNFGRNTWPMWLVFAAGVVLAWRKRDWTRSELVLLGVLAIYFVYVFKVGGDPVAAFPLWRHFVHIAPLWIFLIAAAISRLCKDNLQAVWLAVAVALVTDGTMVILNKNRGDLVQPGYQTSEPDSPYFNFVNRFATDRMTATISLAGQWGWNVRANMIDMLGLNDRHIAHFGTFDRNGELDSKSDMPYVMAQHPEIIDAFMSGIKLRAGECPVWSELGRGDMLRKMLRYPGVIDDYFFVTNAPYDSIDRALFVSKTIADRARAVGGELVPLRSTILANEACTQ